MKKIIKVLLMGSLILSTVVLSSCKTEKAGSSAISSEKTTESSSSQQQTSSSSIKEEAMQEMDFNRIKAGNYSSLIGEWQIVAVSVNRQDGNGDSWITPKEGYQLTVTESQLTTGDMSLSGNVLNDGQDKAVTYSENSGHLQADTQEGAIIWNISFYPKAVLANNWGDLPKAVDQTKERIFIRTSNNNFVQIFQRKEVNATRTTTSAESQTTTTSEQKATKMDISQIKTGNFSSIAGNWRNGRGATIKVSKEKMEFSDVSGQQWPATLTGTKLDIPSKNAEDGKPKQVPYLGDTTTAAYEPQMKNHDADGYTYFTTGIPSAFIGIAFLPSGVMGDLQDGEVEKEKIIAIGTQNSTTSVPSQDVYYKVSTGE